MTIRSKSRAIRVAYVVGNCVPGGVRSVLFSYLRNLPYESISFDVIAYKGVSQEDKDFVKDLGGQLFEVTPVANPIEYCIDLFNILRSNDYNVCHSMLNTLNPLALRVAKKVGIPVRIAENLSAGHPREKKSAIKSLLKPFASWWSTDIAANSELAGKWLYGRNYYRCEILPNPIEFKKFEFDQDLRRQTRDKLQIDSRFVVGWIGRFAPQKNPLFLLDMLRSMVKINKEIMLLTIGYGPLEDEFLSRMHSMDLQSHVIHIGKTEDLVRYYSAMDCFVLPSLYEGLPVVGLEAQANGLPCLFSSEVTSESAITDKCQFLPLDAGAESWAEAALGYRGIERTADLSKVADSKFEQKRSVDKLVQYYQRCLKGALNE